MKSTIKKKTWKAIYRLLDRVSPVDFDCGSLCGSACCMAGSGGDGDCAGPGGDAGMSCGAPGGKTDGGDSATASGNAGGDAGGGDGTCAEPSGNAGGTPEMGIYLYPGEEKLLKEHADWLEWTSENAEDFDFPDSWRGKVYFVKCLTPPHCPRQLRPMQCRTFPLAPHITEDGILTLIYNDEQLPYRCPLIYGEHCIDERFYRATYTVWRRLLKDPLIYDLIEAESMKRW